MSRADQVCKYAFFLYFGAVVIYGLYSWLLGFKDSNMAILDPYEGRAEMYLDGFHE